MTLEQAREKCSQYGQEHLLAFYEDLSPEEQADLLNQIETLDLAGINDLYDKLVVHRDLTIKDEVSAIPSEKLWELSQEEKKELWDLGLKTIRQGKTAVFLVAGGQGSRLGFDGPKGAFNIGLPSGKSLFQIQAERLLAMSRLAGVTIPWYIMTSPLNHDATVTFFKKHDFFGLPEDSIHFFPQGTLPSVTEDGKIILADRHKVSANPDGSGGCFTAFAKTGYLEDLKAKGIGYIFFYGVDNSLVRILDPLFVGFAVNADKDVASKAVTKTYPAEKMGVYAYRNGKPSIIEYTEIPDDLREARDGDGDLLYGAGNIVTHLIKVPFLEKATQKKPSYHIAHKKVAYVDEAGVVQKPSSPNAYKFEALYFDLFALADDMAILEVQREDEFAPVKNFEGADSKDTAREAFLAMNKRWLENLGLEVNQPMEISPLLAIYGHELKKEEVEKLLAEAENNYLKP